MKKAFTLLELVVVVAVIGIVASLAVPEVSNAYRCAQISSALSTARILEAAKDAYAMANPGAIGNISAADLAQYLPKGMSWDVKTPFKTAYSNVLNLDEPVYFTFGGKTYLSTSNEM